MSALGFFEGKGNNLVAFILYFFVIKPTNTHTTYKKVQFLSILQHVSVSYRHP